MTEQIAQPRDFFPEVYQVGDGTNGRGDLGEDHPPIVVERLETDPCHQDFDRNAMKFKTPQWRGKGSRAAQGRGSDGVDQVRNGNVPIDLRLPGSEPLIRATGPRSSGI